MRWWFYILKFPDFVSWFGALDCLEGRLECQKRPQMRWEWNESIETDSNVRVFWKVQDMKTWLVLSDEQMSKRWPFSLLNNEQMSNWLGVEHQPETKKCDLSISLIYLEITKNPMVVLFCCFSQLILWAQRFLKQESRTSYRHRGHSVSLICVTFIQAQDL